MQSACPDKSGPIGRLPRRTGENHVPIPGLLQPHLEDQREDHLTSTLHGNGESLQTLKRSANACPCNSFLSSLPENWPSTLLRVTQRAIHHVRQISRKILNRRTTSAHSLNNCKETSASPVPVIELERGQSHRAGTYFPSRNDSPYGSRPAQSDAPWRTPHSPDPPRSPAT